MIKADFHIFATFQWVSESFEGILSVLYLIAPVQSSQQQPLKNRMRTLEITSLIGYTSILDRQDI